MKTYSSFDEVKAAIPECRTRHDLVELSDHVDSLFMAGILAVSDDQWREFTVLLADREDELPE